MILNYTTKEPREQKSGNTTITVFRTILNKYHKSGILKIFVQYLTDCNQRMSH